MIRDFVAGILWGGVVAAAGLGVISQVAQPPAPRHPPQATAAPEIAAPDAVAPEAEMPAETPQADPPAEPVPAAAAEPAAKPEAPPAAPAEMLADAPPAPPEGAAAPASPASDAAPALPGTAATPPAPAAEPAPETLAQAPANPPDTSDPEEPAAPAPSAAPAPTSGTTDPAAPATDPATPAAPAADAAPSAADLPPPAPEPPGDPLLEPGAEAAPEPPPASVAPEAEPQPEPAPAPETATLPADPGLAPAPALGDKADGVTVGRLPRIGAAEDDTAVADPAAEPADLPPLSRYAAVFPDPAGKPLFAIVLVDDGTPELDRARLAALPFPVTFAIDPLAANAAEAAATYRAAGKEVAMLATGIPAGATAADLEQTFQALATGLPEAVAVIDLASGGFQDDRGLAAQVVPIVKAQGRGLITFDRGLNAADQVARREDVPAATVFRQIDAEGEEIPTIRRYLDRAAFKAAQEGRVTVLGSARPETVAGILEWTIEGRAASVALAPASAVMVVN